MGSPFPFRRWTCAPPERGAQSERLARDGRDAGRLGTLLSLAGLEFDPGPLVEGLVTLAGDLRVMDEQILPTLVGRDESVALRSVEPFNDTSSHICTPPLPLTNG